MTALLRCATLFLVFSAASGSARDESLRVRAEAGRGPFFVGQGIEVRLTVVGGRNRPTIELPPFPAADAWLTGTEKRPISRSEIGSIVGEENQFLMRIRVVPTRAGTLQIPSIAVRVEQRSARSPSLHVEVLPVPAEGRPAAFLGGIGQFVPEAVVSSQVMRVGQEFDLRVTVAGPGALGMTDPPELARYDRVPLGLRIRPATTQTSHEPPERTFTYRLRPTRAGEAILPPISIASFDPSHSRFLTHVTRGIPIRVVAVSAFDPATIDDGTASSRTGRSIEGQWVACGLSAIALAGVYTWLSLVRRRLRSRRLARESAARRYAASLARSLVADAFLMGASPAGSAATAPSNGDLQCPLRRAARRVSDMLIHYLELGASRPPGALTPEEAAAGVSRVSRSAQLGVKAGRLMALSDRVLYGEAPVESGAPALKDQAKALFEALGSVKTS